MTDPRMNYDLFKIEREAQRLRAQVLANGVKRLISWLKSHAPALSAGRGQTA